MNSMPSGRGKMLTIEAIDAIRVQLGHFQPIQICLGANRLTKALSMETLSQIPQFEKEPVA